MMNSKMQAQAVELADRFFAICREYDPAVVLVVLEAGIVQITTNASPALGDLLIECMADFKKKGRLMIEKLENDEKVNPEREEYDS
jgi:hypothetical protein